MEHNYPVIDITSDDDSSNGRVSSSAGGASSSSAGGRRTSASASASAGTGASHSDEDEDDSERNSRREYTSITRFVNSLIEEEDRSHARLNTSRHQRRTRRRVSAADLQALTALDTFETAAVAAGRRNHHHHHHHHEQEAHTFGMDAAAMAEAQPPVTGDDAGKDEILNQVISLVDGETVPTGSTCMICIASDNEVQTQVGNGWVQTRCACGRGNTTIDVACMCSNCLVQLVQTTGWICPVCRGDMRG
jgi:hypothetical protein